MTSGTSTWSFTLRSGLPSISRSRLNSLASTISVRSSRPRSSRSSTSCATGASICFFISRQPRVAVLVRVPVQERDVLGRHLDVARARFDQPPRQQAAEAEAADHLLLVPGAEAILLCAELLPGLVAGHVLADVLERLERQVERLRRRRAQQAVGVVVRAEQRVALVAAALLADRARVEQLPVEACRDSRSGPASCRPAGARRRRRRRDTAR